MRFILNLIAVLLIIIGGLTIAYKGFTYNFQHKIGSIERIHLTPMNGGIILSAGIVLLIIFNMNRK